MSTTEALKRDYLTDAEFDALVWLRRLSEPDMYRDRIGPFVEWLEPRLAALAATSAPAERPTTPEGEAERFIQAAISNSPKPLQELGRHLSDWLDEDKWATAERLLLAIATTKQELRS